MLETRKVLTAVIGYIIGILMGLYCKISIVPFYILIFLICLVIGNGSKKEKFKLFSFRRYFRYVKILFNKKVIKIIVIFSIISNTIVLWQNYKYENLYKDLDGKNCKMQGIVCNVTKETVTVKIVNNKYKNTYLYLYFKGENVEYGEQIEFYGMFSKPEKSSNYKGFDRFEYYKTKKIYGTVKCTKVVSINKNKGNLIKKYINNILLKIKQRIENSELKDDAKSLLEGILLGDKENISEEIIENFSESNISHLLAVSGMHVTYIVIIMDFVLSRIVGRHYSKLINSIMIIIYMCMVDFTPSIVRAGITAIIAIMANFVYRRNDIYENLSIALMVILINNPFSIKDIGVELSFSATIGILVVSKNLKKFYKQWIEKINRKAIRKNKKIVKKIVEILNFKLVKLLIDGTIITISATIMVMPVMILNFNSITITSLFISVISSLLIGPIIIIGIIFIITKSRLIMAVTNVLASMLIKLSAIGSMLPLNKIYIITPKIFEIVIYYIIIFISNFVISLKLEKRPNAFKQRVQDILRFIKYKIKLKKIICVLLIIGVLNLFYLNIPKNLRIYFVDVGQGDCTLIVTPYNKSILIDGGGSQYLESNFNVGKSILMPYLLDRQIVVIDYVIFSHMDSDHSQGLLYVMENMKVRNVILGTQFEKSDNYSKLIDIATKNNIPVRIVEAGCRINIEQGLYFDVLWPSSNNVISKNSINNNSLVCKLQYKNFSMLFTGDIEELAEKAILSLYKNHLAYVKSTYLKVAHHGSKTSSSMEFLNAVSPQVALIGVGKNNKFGHPSDITLENLKKINCKIYRTDEMGEIDILLNLHSNRICIKPKKSAKI